MRFPASVVLVRSRSAVSASSSPQRISVTAVPCGGEAGQARTGGDVREVRRRVDTAGRTVSVPESTQVDDLADRRVGAGRRRSLDQKRLAREELEPAPQDVHLRRSGPEAALAVIEPVGADGPAVPGRAHRRRRAGRP